MKKIGYLLLISIIIVLLSGCIFKQYELDKSYEYMTISDSVNPYDSELVNGMCNYDLSDKKVILENETNIDNLMFEEDDYDFFEVSKIKIFKLRLTCKDDSVIFNYIIDEDNDGLLKEVFLAETINETYQKYNSEMEYLYDLETIQMYSSAKLINIFKELVIEEDHDRLKFFVAMGRAISYHCDVSEVGMTCSRVVYSSLGLKDDPNRRHYYEKITVYIIYGQQVRDSEVTYYIYDGCYAEAELCDLATNDIIHEFLYHEWNEYIDISRDPRNERSDSRDFYQRATSVIGDYMPLGVID